MTPEDARMVARIVSRADGGCSCCVGGLVSRLKDKFPDFDWSAMSIEAEKERERILAESDYDYDKLPAELV